MRRLLSFALVLGILLMGVAVPAMAQDTLKIGAPQPMTGPDAPFGDKFKKAYGMAVEEINAKGGINDRKLEIVSRDDGGTPGDAVRVAEELISREKADVLMGTFASNVGLAVANLANQRKIVFLASEPLTDKIVWENGNRYTFRLRPSTYMQTAMLIQIGRASCRERV